MYIQGNLDGFFLNPGNKNHILRTSGKFGSTYIGKRKSDQAGVVIKKLDSSLNKNPKAVARFKREAEINIKHPGLAKATEYFMFNNEHYLVREYIPGMDMGKFSSMKRKDVRLIIECGIGAAEALAALHQKAIIHRDVRPANIIVNHKAGELPAVSLIDLGLARMSGDNRNEKIPFALIYSPPEQVMNCGAAVNASSDLYSLAVSLYECITGRIPFYYDNPEMMMHLQITKPLEPHKTIPAEVFRILSKASSKYAFRLPPNKYKKDKLLKLMLEGQEERYHSAYELIADLRNVSEILQREEKKSWTKVWKRS